MALVARPSLARTVLAALLLAALLLGAAPAAAHQPEVNFGSPDPAAPYDVPFPEVSRSVRGVVPAGGRDFFQFSVGVTGPLELWLLVPLAVEAPPDRGGSYTFAIGQLEIPGGGISPDVQRRWATCPSAWEA